MKTALISGISGQDGSYLSELLLEKGYKVHGIMRRTSTPSMRGARIKHLTDKGLIEVEEGDLLDLASLEEIVKKVRPDEVYNLAAQSHVGISFQQANLTTQVNAVGVLNMLEAVRQYSPNARFYQASSSEIFGNSIDEDGFQRMSTPKIPVSPYGCAKLFSHNIVKCYRESYEMFACSGVHFVTQKIVRGAVAIKLGLQDKLELGNLDAYRDWSHSQDMVEGMWLMLNYKEPKDWLMASGISHSVRDFCKIAFNKLGFNYEDYVVINPKFCRPNELFKLKGDSVETREVLGWSPKYNFEDLVNEMIEGNSTTCKHLIRLTITFHNVVRK